MHCRQLPVSGKSKNIVGKKMAWEVIKQVYVIIMKLYPGGHYDMRAYKRH